MSVAIGVFGACGVAASGWALQAAALPAPKSADRVLADASTWLHEYRFAVDVFHAGPRPVRAACLRGAVVRRGRPRPGGILSFGQRSVILVTTGGRVSLLSGSRLRVPPARLAADAGCTGALELALVRAAQTGDHISVERAWAAHQPTLALEVQRGDQGRLTVYVSPKTSRPLVAVVHAKNLTVKTRLYLTRIAAPLLHRFHLPVPGSRAR